MVGGKSKFLLVLVFLFLVSTVSAANIQFEGLSSESINASWTGDGVNFQTSYLNNTVDYGKVFKPDDLSTKDGVQVKTKTEKENSTQVEISFQVASDEQDYEWLQDAKFSGKIDLKKGEKKSSFVNGSITSDKDEEIKIDSDSHYEHLILDYNLTDAGVEQNTTENVYSGNDTEKIPVVGYVDQKSSTKVVQKITKDNLYEPQTTEKLVVAYKDETSIESIDFKGMSYTDIGTIDYSSEIEPELDNAEVSIGYVDNPEDYTFQAYNVTYPSDSQKTVDITLKQPEYNPLTDKPSNYEFSYYSYIIGSVATFSTNSSSEWSNGTFTNTTETSGDLKLKSSDYKDTFEEHNDGDTPDEWTGDTGSFEADTGNVLSGSVTGLLNAGGELGQVDSPDINSDKEFSWEMEISKDTENSAERVRFYIDGYAARMTKVFFYHGSNDITARTGDSGESTIGTWTPDTKIDVRLIPDFTNNEFEIFIDGSSKGTYNFQNNNDLSDLKKISYAWYSEGSNWDQWIDDVSVGVDESSGSYESAIYNANEKKVWDNITVGNFSKNGGSIDIWVKTSNDGFSTTLEQEKVSDSELSSSGTDTIDLSLSQGATDVKYNISYSKGSSSPSIDSIELDGKTANAAPNINQQEVLWQSIGGTETKELNFSINDPDGNEIDNYLSNNGLTEQAFDNSTMQFSGWTSPVDTQWQINDTSNALSSKVDVNFTVEKDTGIQENTVHNHTLDDQQTEYEINVKNRGDNTNYTVSFNDDGTVETDGSVTDSEITSGSYLNTTEVWSNDFITGETENDVRVQGENSSRTHDWSTQYILNETELVTDNSKSFKFTGVDISSQCENVVSADVPSGTSKQVTNNCSTVERTGDDISEKQYDFTPEPSSIQLDAGNYTGKQNNEFTNTRTDINFTDVSNSGYGNGPTKCTQSNSTTKDIDTNTAVNYTTGYTCDPGDKGTPVQTIVSINSNTDRVWYNSTDMVIETNETEETKFLINASEDNLKTPDERDGGTLEAHVNGKFSDNTDGLSVSDIGDYIQVTVDTNFQSSSLHTDDTDWGITYILSASGTGTGGGGGGGGGTTEDNVLVNVTGTDIQASTGSTTTERITVQNLAGTENTVELSTNPGEKQCSRVKLEQGELGTGFGTKGRYTLDGQGSLQDSRSVQVQVEMPSKSFFENQSSINCPLTVGTSEGVPPTDVELEIRPQQGLLEQLKSIIQFDLGIDLDATLFEFDYTDTDGNLQMVTLTVFHGILILITLIILGFIGLNLRN